MIVFSPLIHKDQKHPGRHVYYAPPIFFKYFHFGHSESIADALWLRLVQDIDLCADTFTNANTQEIASDEEKKENPRLCSRGWAFRMFDIISELAPRFRIVQAVGGLTLSVLLDDYDSADIMFRKAVKNFPDDWPILYRAGYFYMVEKEDPGFAGELFARASSHPDAPDWVRLTAARMYSKAGQKEAALRILHEYLEFLTDPEAKKSVEAKIQALVKESENTR